MSQAQSGEQSLFRLEQEEKIFTKMANKQLNTAKAKDTVKNCSEEAVCKGNKVPLLKA